MSGTNTTINSVTGTSTLVRARFGPGMLLHHEDLEQLNTYTRELSRLLFRSLFGCGVVCGLVVKTKGDCGKVTVTVTAGLALDCSGDPIHLPDDQTLALDEHCAEDIPAQLWVTLCRTSKCCSPRKAVCGSDEDDSSPVCTRERDLFEIRIVSDTKCTCGCREKNPVSGQSKSYEDHYAGNCGCNTGQECECACECVLLAELYKDTAEKSGWKVDHSVRCFVRPAFIPDPQVKAEYAKKAEKEHEQETAKEYEREALRQELAREQAVKEQAAKDQAAKDQAAKDQAAKDQAAKDQAAKDQAVKDQAAKEQLAREQAVREQVARVDLAREQLARERAKPARSSRSARSRK